MPRIYLESRKGARLAVFLAVCAAVLLAYLWPEGSKGLPLARQTAASPEHLPAIEDDGPRRGGLRGPLAGDRLAIPATDQTIVVGTLVANPTTEPETVLLALQSDQGRVPLAGDGSFRIPVSWTRAGSRLHVLAADGRLLPVVIAIPDGSGAQDVDVGEIHLDARYVLSIDFGLSEGLHAWLKTTDLDALLVTVTTQELRLMAEELLRLERRARSRFDLRVRRLEPLQVAASLWADDLVPTGLERMWIFVGEVVPEGSGYPVLSVQIEADRVIQARLVSDLPFESRYVGVRVGFGSEEHVVNPSPRGYVVYDVKSAASVTLDARLAARPVASVTVDPSRDPVDIEVRAQAIHPRIQVLDEYGPVEHFSLHGGRIVQSGSDDLPAPVYHPDGQVLYPRALVEKGEVWCVTTPDGTYEGIVQGDAGAGELGIMRLGRKLSGTLVVRGMRDGERIWLQSDTEPGNLANFVLGAEPGEAGLRIERVLPGALRYSVRKDFVEWTGEVIVREGKTAEIDVSQREPGAEIQSRLRGSGRRRE